MSLLRTLQLQSVSGVSNHYDCLEGKSSPTRMDPHANMCCVGINFIPYSFTGKVCTVSPYNEEYKPIDDVRVCSAYTTIDETKNGTTIIACINQALHFGKNLKNSLINPNKLQSFGIKVNDNLYNQDLFFGITDPETGI